jgi:hypothetical protein
MYRRIAVKRRQDIGQHEAASHPESSIVIDSLNPMSTMLCGLPIAILQGSRTDRRTAKTSAEQTVVVRLRPQAQRRPRRGHTLGALGIVTCRRDCLPGTPKHIATCRQEGDRGSRRLRARPGRGIVPGDRGFTRVVVIMGTAVHRDQLARTGRIAPISWVTVSWVPTASSSTAENARRVLPASAPVWATTALTASKIRLGRSETANRRQ